MIKNERQYQITKAQVARLDHALAELTQSFDKEKNIHPLLLKAEHKGINSQLTDLCAEIKEYEELHPNLFIL